MANWFPLWKDNGLQIAQCYCKACLSSKNKRNVPSTSNREASGRNSGLALVACLLLCHLGARGLEGSDCQVWVLAPLQMKGEGKLLESIRGSAVTVTLLLCYLVSSGR